MRRGSPWNDEAVEKLKELWPTTRAVEIARTLGPGFTRASIIGKAHWEGLPTIGYHEHQRRVSDGTREAKAKARSQHG